MHDPEKLDGAGFLGALVQPAHLAAPPLAADHAGDGALHLFHGAVLHGGRLDEVVGAEGAQGQIGADQETSFEAFAALLGL
jgi:hypothetical protein